MTDTSSKRPSAFLGLDPGVESLRCLRIENTVLFGPIKNGKPDLEKMAKLTRACGAFPIIQAFRKAAEQSGQKRFAELVEQWKASQGNVSSIPA
jgi:hypothetical protein